MYMYIHIHIYQHISIHRKAEAYSEAWDAEMPMRIASFALL